MSTYRVIDGVLGSVGGDEGGGVPSFTPLVLKSADNPPRHSIVDQLLAGLDYSPLGLTLMQLLGAHSLGALTLEPESPESDAACTFAPRFETTIEGRPTETIFTPQVLEQFHLRLQRLVLSGQLTADTACGIWFSEPLTLAGLPRQLSVVIASKRIYSFDGAVFRTDDSPVLLGLHERSVGDVEAALTAEPSKSNSYAHALTRFKLVAKEKRCIRRLMRVKLIELFQRTRNGLHNKLEFDALVALVESRRVTNASEFVMRRLNQVHALYNSTRLPGFDHEFDSLSGDVMNTIRAIMAERFTTP